MANVIIALSILLIIGAGVILLQIFLSKRENKWFGLILPIICLFISLIAVFSIASFTSLTNSSLKLTTENGTVVQEITPEVITQGEQSSPSLVFTIASVLLLYNIPTAVLLVIYFACREKQRQKKALEKMQAQDLE